MAMKCYNCGKGIQIGHNVSHSKRRTRKVWKPNLQYFRLKETVSGNRKKVRLCVSCLRRAKEDMRKLMQRETIEKIQAPQITP